MKLYLVKANVCPSVPDQARLDEIARLQCPPRYLPLCSKVNPPPVLLCRPDWIKSLAFGAPLDIWYDWDAASGEYVYNHQKPLDSTAKYYCPAYYAAKELAKKIITTILESDGAK